MLNTQKPLKLDRVEDGSLVVHSYFHTIQGEGPFAGQAAFFIRLAGCNLQCPWCDTEYIDGARRMSVQEIFDLIRDEMNSFDEIIVITGGEPFRQNLIPLLDEILLYDFHVQIETNGVLYPGDGFPWMEERLTVVCSPKTGKIHPDTARKVDAYKYVLRHDDVAADGLPVHALGHPLGSYLQVARPPELWDGPIFLQPMDAQDPVENELNRRAVAESVMKHKRYTMGVQMHKELGLP